MSRRTGLALLLALAICPYFVDLGGSSIWDANEAFYVETPREMMERGDYISPTFNYQPRENKPVLSYWIVAAFYHLFGVSVGVQRIPIAIGALGLVAVAFWLGRAAAPERETSAWWSAIGLAISPRLVMFGRRILIDIYISLFMSLALLFFALAERDPARRRLFLVLMYVSVGLGVLTKGPIAALLPGLAFAIYLLIHGELRRVREMLVPVGAVIVAVIVLPWYIALYVRSGWSPITTFLLGENVARFTEGVGVSSERGPLYYLPVVFSDSFPWSLFLIAAALAWFADRRRAASERDAGSRIRTLLWVWILTIVGFFSLSVAKQDLYIFPIVSAVAALGGVAVARAVERGGEGRSIRVTTVVMALLLIAAGTGILYLFQTALAVYTLPGTAATGAIGLAGGFVVLLVAWRARATAALLAAVIAVTAFNWVFVLRVLPGFEAYKPSPRLAAELTSRAATESSIATYNVALPSLVYYLRRHIDVYYDHAPVLRLLESGRRVDLIAFAHDYDAMIKPVVQVPTCVVSTHPMFEVKLKSVLSRAPLPQLLLVSNRCGG